MVEHRQVAGLLNRRAEFEWLTDRVADVSSNGAHTALICGEAGIGKTSLVDAFLEARSDLAVAVVGRCHLHDPDPFGPIRSWLAALAGLDAAAQIGWDTAGIPAIGLSADEMNARRYKAFASMTDQLLGCLDSGPAVLVIDDLHWGQPPLHDFVRFLAAELDRRRVGHQVLLLLVTRPLPPPHPVAALVADLDRSPRLRRHDLGELSAGAIDQIVVEATGATTSGTFLELTRRAARGNPLRAKAAVRVLQQRRVPLTISAADDRSWSELRLPGTPDDPVTAWITGLDPALRTDLGRVAVLGHEFSLTDAAAVMEDPAQLDAAAEEGLTGSDGRSGWFMHSLFREAAYDALSLSDRQTAHRAAATWAQAHHDRSAETLIRVGRHLIAAGTESIDRAGEALADAGTAALTLTLWNEAARFFEAAIRAGRTTDATFLGALGHAYYFDHNLEAAGPHLASCIELAERDEGPEPVWAAAVVTWLRMITTTDPESLRRPADRQPGLAFLATARDPKLRSVVLQILAEMHIMAGNPDDSSETAAAAGREAAASGDQTALALARYAQAFADMTALRIHAGIDGTRQAVSHARRGGDWFVQNIVDTRLGFPLFAAGEVAEADHVAARAVADADANHEHANQALGLSVRTAAALVRADLDSTIRLAAQTQEETRRSGYVLADMFSGPALIVAHIAAGELDAAEHAISAWPNLPRVARAAYQAVLEACGERRTPPALDMLRPPSRATFISAGFHLAVIDAALLAGQTPDLDTGLLHHWRDGGLEYPLTYPTSLTRLLGEVLAVQGEPSALPLLREAITRSERAGAQLELARSLAGLARTATDHGEQEAALTRLGDLVDRIGLHPALLGRVPRRAPTTGSHTRRSVVMITDIVGSTTISRDLGDVAYLDLIMRHHALVRRRLSDRTGHEFSEAGDGLLAWFETVDDAVRCAFEIQQEITTTNEIEPKLRLKIALAVGDPLFHEGRPYGLVLNRAARLLDHAQPDDVVVDQDLAGLLSERQLIARNRTAELRGIGLQRLGYLDINRGAFQSG